METNTETTETESPDVEPVEATEEVQVPAVEQVEKTPVERPVSDRKNRKAQRLDVEAAQNARREIEATLATERAERLRLDREVAEMRGQLSAREQQAQAKDQDTQVRDKIANLRKQAKAHLFFSSQAKDQASADREWDEHQRLMDEADDLRDEQRAGRRWQGQRQELTQNMPDPQAAQALVGHETSYPWLTTNKEAVNMADTRLTYLVNNGRPYNRQTVVEALAWTAKAMALGGHSAPSDRQRAAYGGVPGGEGAGGSERPASIRVGRHEEALAKAAYPQLEAKDAVKQWVKDVSARMNPTED